MEKRRGGDGDNRRGDKKRIDEMEKNRRDGKK